jgi:hypothetical protein
MTLIPNDLDNSAHSSRVVGSFTGVDWVSAAMFNKAYTIYKSNTRKTKWSEYGQWIRVIHTCLAKCETKPGLAP